MRRPAREPFIAAAMRSALLIALFAIAPAGANGATITVAVRLPDGAEILVRRNGTAAVAALAWNTKGTLLAFAAEDGDSGLLEL